MLPVPLHRLARPTRPTDPTIVAGRSARALSALALAAALPSAPALPAGDVAPSPIPGKVLKRKLPENARAPKDRMTPSLGKGGIRDAWLQLPTKGSGCGDDLIFDYGVDG